MSILPFDANWTIKNVPRKTRKTIERFAKAEGISEAEALTRIVEALDELGEITTNDEQ